MAMAWFVLGYQPCISSPEGGGRSVSDVLWEIASLNADIPLAERMKGGSRVFCFPSIESKRSVLGDTYRI